MKTGQKDLKFDHSLRVCGFRFRFFPFTTGDACCLVNLIGKRQKIPLVFFA